MNNLEVSTLMAECKRELEAITALLTGLGDGARPAPYIKKYAVIRATGSIEAGFKQIIADRVDRDSHTQLKNFVAKKIRNSSSNPKLEIIQDMISEFDGRWRARFDEKMALEDKPTLKGALTELVNARNSFAHGGVAELPIEQTVKFFELGCKVLEILDETVHEVFE
ncbi:MULTISPECIES: HEPN domain-containing protein [Acidithiobacillus]|uniref:RiboL-PSP-HEPN domain-containing protein n=2 Tax=Acidithiobacillus TaxID=119977 RepID=A0A179BL69_ACIFR|nr:MULTISPECIES: HEPN domain-containing protein [Acidithiobacillus]MBU2853505.1 hypothetical protein [Acidithiobacillus ferriphilus]MEB8485561.1 HEPN domain-containing protein [Acidithiobacillus ferriphilus]MEB8490157.1 HEPN domain-containing protein [Acidithiobacillus ferriphilus]MEB8493488.1 HEPN domain-containing protein [Acidithiobacillus ferriphilus]MEB8515225.1 HEPN domain-containing protein [Acidithiobacillus ferriphilus]